LNGRDIEKLFVYGRVEKGDAVVILDELRLLDLIDGIPKAVRDAIAEEQLQRLARVNGVGLTPCKP